MSDKEIKDNTKKPHILIKVKSKDSDKEGLSDKKQTKAEEIQKKFLKIQVNLEKSLKRIYG